MQRATCYGATCSNVRRATCCATCYVLQVTCRDHCAVGDSGRLTSQVLAARGHGGVAFGDQGAIAAPGVGAGQAGHSCELAGHGHAGVVEEAACDLAQRGLGTRAPAEGVRKPADGQRPDVGEFRLVVDLARHHEHGRLELVHRPGEGVAIIHAGVCTQVAGAHLPLAAQDAQDCLCVTTEAALLLHAADTPDGVEPRHHPRREEHGLPARELGVIDVAAPDDLVLQRPRQRCLFVFLHVARHDGVAPPADRDIQGRPRPAAVGQAGGKASLLDEALRLERRLHLPHAFAPPAPVAVVLYRGRNVGSLSHGPRNVLRATSATVLRAPTCDVLRACARCNVPTSDVPTCDGPLICGYRFSGRPARPGARGTGTQHVARPST